MDAYYSTHLIGKIDDLSPQQVFLACRLIVLALDRRLARMPSSLRPQGLLINEFEKYIPRGGTRIVRWAERLMTFPRTRLTQVGRRLMILCVKRGFGDEVRDACALIKVPFQRLEGLPRWQIVGALAAVLTWTPQSTHRRHCRASQPRSVKRRRRSPAPCPA
jgi:hypothetical protein